MNELRLKEYRERLKLSQNDIAQLLNLTQQAYSSWENGKSFPNAKQIIQLCDIFKCSPNDLFGFRGVHIVVGDKLRNNDKIKPKE